MSRILEYILRYFIIVIVFVYSAFFMDLNILYYSVFLIYIVLIQLLLFKSSNENIIIINLLLQLVTILFLYNGDFILLSLLIVNPVIDIYKYLNFKRIILINIVYLILILFLISQSRSLKKIIIILLMYLFSTNIGNLLKGKNRNIKLELKIDELLNEKNISELENKRKDSILKDIYIAEERNRISRDIHDSVGHSLSAIIIQLSAIEKIAIKDGEKASKLSGNLREYAANSLEEIRKVLRQTKPKNIGENELIILIENLIEENRKLKGIDINFKFSATRYPLEYNIQNTIFNGVKEFVSNSIKHGHSSKIDIKLFFKERKIILNMKDNGIGKMRLLKELV